MISWPGRGRTARDEADILFAFREWLKAHDGRVGKLSLRPDAAGPLDGPPEEGVVNRAFHLSPGIAVAEPSVDLKRLRTGDDRSVAKRLSRVIVRACIIFALVAAAVAWPRYADDRTKAMAQAGIAKAWEFASAWLPSVLQPETGASSGVAGAPVRENPDQAVTQEPAAQQTASVAPQAAPGSPQTTALAQPAPGSAQTTALAQPGAGPARATALVPPMPAPVAPAISPELEQKLEALQTDLADMRRLVEQIASRQEEMAQDMVTLQIAQQSQAQRLPPPPPQTAAAAGAPHPRKITPAEAATSLRSPPGSMPYPGSPPYPR